MFAMSRDHVQAVTAALNGTSLDQAAVLVSHTVFNPTADCR